MAAPGNAGLAGTREATKQRQIAHEEQGEAGAVPGHHGPQKRLPKWHDASPTGRDYQGAKAHLRGLRPVVPLGALRHPSRRRPVARIGTPWPVGGGLLLHAGGNVEIKVTEAANDREAGRERIRKARMEAEIAQVEADRRAAAELTKVEEDPRQLPLFEERNGA